ncbi:DUF5362 family protein [Flavobacterium subsaxonicum]|uniref:DUF5362 domain-containing protein n=1 Tax=Flavobacterium subsaxonicum WB 4.1-42 = DSM 21790 TaxID=1121898 RepID=A0A0A2N434_9FLAO|nr:DUF5362 family protein [Flavobacterium subsaxonicum]KGO95165.1 hypothetical protein Q766_03460 [Flavobacterium subsaxonicum WB 4.1-42 = DSM 21790]
MENNAPYQDTKSAFDTFELQLTPQAQAFLKETAKWATFLAIVGFLCVAFGIMLGIFYVAMASTIFAGPGMPTQMQYVGPALGAVFIIGSLITIFPIIYLLQFASKTKAALSENNTEKLTGALSSLKSHYKFVGIFTIIVIALYIFAIIAAVVAGAAAASSM